jgi:hypothetical protein
MVSDGYDTETAETAEAEAGTETETETETEIEDGSDVRLECLKLAVAFSKTKDQSPPIAVAKQFLAFVLAKEPAAPSSDGQEPTGRTSP